MIRKVIIMLVAVMLIGITLTGCVDKDENQNAPTQQEQQQRRDQRNLQRDYLNPYTVDRINPDGSKG